MESIAIQTKSLNLTDEQFFRLCADNRDLRFERDKNKNILIMSPTGYFTGNFNAEISGELRDWNKKTKLGFVFDSSTGFTLPNSSIRSPDVSWVEKSRAEKLSIIDKEKFAPICPDFVIEIFSKTDSLRDLTEKMNEWIENGCRLAWLIDPYTKVTTVFLPNAENEIVSFDNILSGKNILPGFELTIAQIL